jgi:8-oxo-dGTP pyrophosphatase MutT (NUDIX family)
MENLSYILKLRRALKDELRHMPLFQNGSSIVVENDQGEILLQERMDRNQWCLPGGLQELGETFESVAIRELYEETGLTTDIKDLILIKVVSGPSRYNTYPNGDEVYNNSVVYLVKNYSGTLNSNYQEIVDNNDSLVIQKESKQLKFFNIDNLPSNLMDKDLIGAYIEYRKARQ